MAAGLAGVSLIGYAAIQLRKEGGAGQQVTGGTAASTVPPGRNNYTLAEVSQNWTGKGNLLTDNEFDLKDLAPIWREVEKDAEIPSTKPHFDHEEISKFWDDHVEHRKSIKGNRMAVITRLLKMLDTEGACASVVRNKALPEVDNDYSKDSFDLLSQVPLYLHSINVARMAITHVSHEVLIADVIIVALAHDIGKMPVYHEKSYATGDHPIISSLVMNGIPEYLELGNRDELDKVIRSHHDLKPSNPLAAMLKEADSLVRNDELAKAFNEVHEVSAEKDAAGTPGESIKPVEEKPQEPAPVAAKPARPAKPPAARKEKPVQPDQIPAAEPAAGGQALPVHPKSAEKAHPLGYDKQGGGAFKHDRLELDWLDLDAVLAALKPKINSFFDGGWEAVSQPDGIVYCRPDTLWRAVKESSPRNSQLMAAEADEETKRNILYTVVWELAEKRNAVATDMLDTSFYLCPVTIITGSGRLSTGAPPLLAPFKAEGFGLLPSDLENNKSASIRRMVKSVKPKARG
jgi:hypothetical protein